MWIDYRKGWCCKAFTSPSASTSFLTKVELRDAANRIASPAIGLCLPLRSRARAS
jgi:hypothetical protein